MKNRAEAVIIGGGISGCSIAYNLAKKGNEGYSGFGEKLYLQRVYRQVRSRGTNAVGNGNELQDCQKKH